jgi:hypothetical protein
LTFDRGNKNWRKKKSINYWWSVSRQVRGNCFVPHSHDIDQATTVDLESAMMPKRRITSNDPATTKQ